MSMLVYVMAVIVFFAPAALAANLGTPRLSDNMTTSKFFDPDRLLTTGGLKYEASGNFSLEPEVGLGYVKREQGLSGGYEDTTQKVHARAGGRLNLTDTLHMSAAAKLPVYTYEQAGRIGGDLSFQAPLTRQDYDLLRHPGGNVGWGGEAGIRLGGQTEFNLFYDVTPLSGYQGGTHFEQTEERFGTRFIFRFK
jgi:hypothetical protein